MSAVTRDLIGTRMWENLLRINSIYHNIARGHINPQTGLKEIVKILDAIIDADMVAANIGIWDPQTSVKMVKMIVELKDLVVTETKKDLAK